MPSKVFIVVLAVASILVSFAAAQDRDELLATPKFVKDAKTPVFRELTADQAAAQITMVSGRNSAWFGFNQPEVRLVLPAVDNSVYATVEFGEPNLLDDGGAKVGYELERGLYDHATHHDEIRFNPSDGEGEEPIEFARAVGTVTVRYPLRLRTLSASKDGPAAEGLDVSFDGPYVTRRTTSGDGDLEAASFTGIESFRALDAEGRQIEAAPSTRMSIDGDLVTEVESFWGEVAKVELDVADEWALFRVAYELPAVAPLPKSRAGFAPEGGEQNPPTPGAEVTVEIVKETPGMVIASELGVTPEEAARRLAGIGFPNPTGDFMVMSAVQGNLEAVELFLASGVPIDFAVEDGRTALLSAVIFDHADVATFLLKMGADVNIADSNNATPLFHAAGKCGEVELVRALLAAGADPTPATRGGTTAVEMAGIMGCSGNEAAIRAVLGD
jgi:hypothetical protein